ncbi:MoaD/ThiS family protein [Rhizohabitans arisaemae]|uniref:MoaD/ThiS family protein n=1 Tax=Rhizohabitans arisaemae TaxID=2720610 RepID=UPI0024B1938F|nr:MoaD/ThiS family protein [Rhizohabitans arisaemae]
MVKIIVPSVWAPDGRTEFEGSEGPLPTVIQRFAADNPAFHRRLFGPDAQPLTYVNFCVDDDLVPRQRRATTVVPAGSTLTIITPMAGG